MLKKLLSNIILVSNAFSFSSYGETKRIQSTIIDRGEPLKIQMVSGFGSVVTFPCLVADVYIGDEKQVGVKYSPTNKKILHFSIKNISSKPTNVLIRCEKRQRHIVIDIVPSSIHQDVVEIRSVFGTPYMDLQETETKKTTKEPNKTLIEKGDL
jgi:hypothetical protein